MGTLQITGIGTGTYLVLAFAVAIRLGQFMKGNDERGLAAFEEARRERLAHREAA